MRCSADPHRYTPPVLLRAKAGLLLLARPTGAALQAMHRMTQENKVQHIHTAINKTKKTVTQKILTLKHEH